METDQQWRRYQWRCNETFWVCAVNERRTILFPVALSSPISCASRTFLPPSLYNRIHRRYIIRERIQIVSLFWLSSNKTNNEEELGASRVVDLGELSRPEIWIPVVEVRVWIGGVGFFKEIGRILQDLFYLSNILHNK